MKGLRDEAKKRAVEEGHLGHGRTVSQHGQTRSAGESQFLCVHSYAKAQDSRSCSAAMASPTHRYTMRQAIEEGFILDLLKYYTTYATYFKLLKACQDDPTRRAQDSRAGTGAVHATASAQHSAEDRGYG